MAAKKFDLSKLSEIFNFDMSTVVTPEVVKTVDEFDALEDQRILEAESVIYYIETKGSAFQKRTCKLCSKKFYSNYSNVAMCSNECRRSYLESKGMIWDPTARSESERWGGTIPRIISPEATEILQGMEFTDDDPPETPPPVKDGPIEPEDISGYLDSLID